MKKNNFDIDINLYLDKLQELGLFIQDVENNISYPNEMWNRMGYTSEEMNKMGFLDYVHPDDLPAVKKSMDLFLTDNDRLSRTLFRMKTKAGDWRWILSTSLGVEYNREGKVSKYFGYDHDVTEEIKAKEKAEKALKEAETLKSIGEIITYNLNLPMTIKAILEQAERVIFFTSASVQLLNDNEFEIIGETGFKPEKTMVGVKFLLRENIPNMNIVRERKGIIVNKDLIKKFSGFNDLSTHKILSWMGVPLIYKGKITGVMTFDHSEENRFSDEDLRLAQAFAHQVAIALENSRLYEETKELSIKDPLTNCFTRRHFYDCLSKEIDMAKRYGTNLSLIIFDLDNFKLINDTYGHLVGDEVLVEVVSLTTFILRKTDILCRYGGEEFVALLPSSNMDEAFSAAERIRLSILKNLKHPRVKEKISISVGCTIFNSLDDTSSENMISRADQALYRSKRNGKNMTCTL